LRAVPYLGLRDTEDEGTTSPRKAWNYYRNVTSLNSMRCASCVTSPCRHQGSQLCS